MSRKGSTATAKQKGSASKELAAYFKAYNKKGASDFHWPIFRCANNIVKPTRVLYPGCHRHITASLIFSDVVYIDSFQPIELCFKDPKVLEWVQRHKEYPEETKIDFKCLNFEGDIGEEENSFDMLISFRAKGKVSKPCRKYLKKDGYFLISDAYNDARTLSLDERFKLVAVWDDVKQEFDQSPEALDGHFTTLNGDKINEAQVQESIDKPKKNRSFTLRKEAFFYMFQKLE